MTEKVLHRFGIVPVKLSVKEFTDKANRLYLTVALEGIKKDRVVSMGVQDNLTHVRTSPVTISIHDLFANVNPIDTDFLKYIPNQFLNDEQIKSKHNSVKLYSEKSYAPTFYSHMSRVVDDIKQDKVGANSVVPYLKRKGVKNEEIKWSGIETFLEGKKSVTKAELQEFAAGSMLQIEVQERGETIKYTEEQKRKLDRIETDKNHCWDSVYDLWDEILPNADIFDYMATDNTVTMLSRIANVVKKSEKVNTQEADRLLR